MKEPLPSDGTFLPLGPALENLLWASAGADLYKKGILSALRLAMQLLEMSFNERRPCDGVWLEISPDRKTITLRVQTDNRWQNAQGAANAER